MHTASIDSGRQCALVFGFLIRRGHPLQKNEHENPDFVLIFYIFAAFRHEIAQIVSELGPSSLLVSEDVFESQDFYLA